MGRTKFFGFKVCDPTSSTLIQATAIHMYQTYVGMQKPCSHLHLRSPSPKKGRSARSPSRNKGGWRTQALARSIDPAMPRRAVCGHQWEGSTLWKGQACEAWWVRAFPGCPMASLQCLRLGTPKACKAWSVWWPFGLLTGNGGFG